MASTNEKGSESPENATVIDPAALILANVSGTRCAKAAGASVLTTTNRVTADELRRWLINPPSESGEGPEESVPVGVSLEEMERRLIEATLDHYGGHRARTAKALGIGIRTLSGKLRQYGYAPREKSFVAETVVRMQ